MNRNLMILLIMIAVIFALMAAFGVPLPNPIRSYKPLAEMLAMLRM